MGSWSGWINTRDQLVNQFGGGNHPFYLSPQYQYRRDGNTVYYNVRLNLNYYVNSGWTNVNYNYGCGVKLQWGSASGTHDGSSDWVVTPGNNISQGWHYSHKDYGTYSITNTTGTGTVTIGAYANNQSTKGFDNPPRSGSSYGWHSFSLSIPAMETITITYNDNGGTGGPGTQTKTIGTDIALSTVKPTKASAATTGYTITFSDATGTPDYTSYTTSGTINYTFDHWNTAADNSGTSYAPGATYTGNTAVTLYAIYTSTTVSNGGVPLPQSSAPGYMLQGWARGSASGTIVEDGYTPTQNETLYAVWKTLKGKMSYKSGSSWIPTMCKYKSGSSWYTSLQTHVLPMTLSNFYIEGTEYTFPVPCTWGEWLHSKYNTDFMYADKINGEWRVVVEEAASSSAFVLSELSFASEAEMWDTYITVEYDYNIERVYYYYRLEFIKGSGTQYINTGIQPTANMRAEIDYALHSASDDQKFFGAYNGSVGVCLGTYNSLWRYGTGSWQGNQGSTVTYRVKIVCTGNQFTFNGTTYTNSASISAYSSNIFFGGINYQGSFLQGDSGEIYGLKLYQGDTLVRDMVPCYRGSSVGMYDKVNKMFYDNAGTGTYIKGYERDW